MDRQLALAATGAGVIGFLAGKYFANGSYAGGLADHDAAPAHTGGGGAAAAADKKSGEDLSSRSTTSSAGGGPAAYETKKAVDEYLHFHFGAEEDQMPYSFGPKTALRFMSRVAKIGEPFVQRSGGQKLRAADIGCAVGGACFELAKWCDEVVGIDFSHAFVQAAETMRLHPEQTYKMVEEGDIIVERLARRPDVDGSKISFQQGDACNLSPELGVFDLVLAVNLLCRLPEPRKFLDRLASLVKPGGVVVLVSPHSWLPGWTPRSQWVGGYVDAQGPHRTAEGVAAALGKDFTLLYAEDVPFLIREHVRKFQYGVSHATVWRRKL